MIMRDSTRPGMIPPATPVVAGYADGSFAWTAADWALFPHSVKLSIAVSAATQADILDVELGDATPAEVPGWCDRFSRPGRRAPTVYCSRSSWPAIQAAVGSRHVDYWIGTLDGTTSVPGAVAVQFADYGTYDESTILDPTWVGMEVDTMDMNVARGLAYDLLAALLGYGPETPQITEAIEAYAIQIANNVEGGISGLITDARRNPAYIPARVTALEAALAKPPTG